MTEVKLEAAGGGPEAVEISLGEVARTLGISPDLAWAELKAGRLTSVLEQGAGQDEGRLRLNFFYGCKRGRIVLSGGGEVLQRSCVDFGELRRASRK
ncbi:hypothetical protein SLNSH_06365 [Alsobacter soli]|uniref:Uncharacterized protein n=1 Tax=Alsobacter soli TaxID=2109933 RepID=A0A2T1HWJ7_9HYPH|nr:DUF6522 family protein [Alsobacter soli]PSC05994.1 hypothetical protein SLNSH_06365 [Alsobacter soli]